LICLECVVQHVSSVAEHNPKIRYGSGRKYIDIFFLFSTIYNAHDTPSLFLVLFELKIWNVVSLISGSHHVHTICTRKITNLGPIRPRRPEGQAALAPPPAGERPQMLCRGSTVRRLRLGAAIRRTSSGKRSYGGWSCVCPCGARAGADKRCLCVCAETGVGAWMRQA
jgi:hypothetical protein